MDRDVFPEPEPAVKGVACGTPPTAPSPPRHADRRGSARAQAGRTFMAPPEAFFRAARSSSQMVSGLAMYTLE
jgi:hypothetical protein